MLSPFLPPPPPTHPGWESGFIDKIYSVLIQMEKFYKRQVTDMSTSMVLRVFETFQRFAPELLKCPVIFVILPEDESCLKLGNYDPLFFLEVGTFLS